MLMSCYFICTLFEQYRQNEHRLTNSVLYQVDSKCRIFRIWNRTENSALLRRERKRSRTKERRKCSRQAQAQTWLTWEVVVIITRNFLDYSYHLSDWHIRTRRLYNNSSFVGGTYSIICTYTLHDILPHFSPRFQIVSRWSPGRERARGHLRKLSCLHTEFSFQRTFVICTKRSTAPLHTNYTPIRRDEYNAGKRSQFTPLRSTWRTVHSCLRLSRTLPNPPESSESTTATLTLRGHASLCLLSGHTYLWEAGSDFRTSLSDWSRTTGTKEEWKRERKNGRTRNLLYRRVYLSV